MPSATAVQLPLETKDPREAVAACVGLIRNGTDSLAGAQIHLGLHCGANCGVLAGLAERLPSAALGFRTAGSARALTASQFLSVRAGGLSAFDGMLTDHLLPADALVLVEALLQSPAQAVRSTAFHLSVKNIRWKGAPPEGTGSLHLFDLKAFHRAKRFSLSASLQVPAENPKSLAVKDLFQQVAQETGIPFHRGSTSHVLGERDRSPAYQQAVLAAKTGWTAIELVPWPKREGDAKGVLRERSLACSRKCKCPVPYKLIGRSCIWWLTKEAGMT
jgi:hypothetical protein